jgi:fibronectin-binding autotransporter adhesin
LLFANASIVSFTDLGNATNPVSLSLDVEPDAVFIDSSKNYILSGAGRITGESKLTKNGSGTFTISTAQTYEGGTSIHGGTVAIGHAGALGSGPVTLAGGTLATGTFAPANAIVVSANSSISGGDGGGAHAVRNISGSGVLTLNATSVFDFEGELSGFAGTFALGGTGSFRLFTTTFNGSPDATFDLGTRGLTARQGSAYNLGALGGQAGSFLGMASNNNSASCTYTIGGNHLDSLFAGTIANGSATKLVGIVKTGNGSLTLAGNSTYTGPSAVNAGMLAVTGSLANTTVTVANTGALGGSGSIAGAVACHGTLDPAGTLTLSNGLTLSPDSVLAHDLGSVSDRVDVTGNLTLAGTLNVTAATGFGPGTYTLITYTGSLSDEDGLALGTLPPGYEATVSTATAGQVRLVVTQTLTAFEQWQIEHFGSTTDPDAAPGADPDGDGTDNETEFRLGLDPKNGSASFKASGIMAPDGFTITWPSAPGLDFEVRRSSSLDAPWELLGSVTGTGQFTDPLPPEGIAFYRVILLP